MQLVRGLQNLRPQHRGCVATIGNFDGVHRGHQAILARLRERALELGVPSCVVIFEPQPREFFAPDTAPARLARLRDKLQLLAAEGVRPELDVCVRCGEPGPLVAFDMDQGGVLCRTCRTGAPLSEEALDLMRMILGGRLNDALDTPASRVTHEVAAHATRALEHHIERRLRTVAMFERH